MSHLNDSLMCDGVPIVRLESNWLRADIAPSVGGRVISLIEMPSGHEFLWHNKGLTLRRQTAGSEYDSKFYGGIDELLPNDIPEVINGLQCPDHGELWTTPLEWDWSRQKLKLWGNLPQFGLHYEREMSLRSESPCLDMVYRISNPTPEPRQFLWKLHAALNVQSGDIIDCPARTAQVVDLAWSRYHSLEPFDWPIIEGQTASLVPPPDGTVDFFYLFNLARGEMSWRRPSQGLRFSYQFDPGVFPYAWIFASYGGFNGHYTVILEPCTTMPLSVNEAAAKKQCSFLQPGETLETQVSIWASRDYKS